MKFLAPPPPTRNIIANGTFETGTSGWYTFNSGTIAATTARARTGTQSLVIGNRTGNAPAATDITSVVSTGKSYPFSLWASVTSADGSAQQLNVTSATTCKAADGTTTTQYQWIASPKAVAADGSWTQFTGAIAVPSCTLTQLQFWVEGAAGTATQIFVDDVEVLENLSSNLITDGTFENGQIGGWNFGFNYTTLGVVTEAFHSGTQSLKGGGMKPNGAMARDIKALVQPGKKYTATAWVSVANRTGGSGQAKWQTIRNCNAESDSFPGMAFPTVTNGQWVQVTGTIDLTACTTVNKLTLFAGADAGDLYLDDVSLTLIP